MGKKYLEGTRIEDLIGLKFGKLTVIDLDYERYKQDTEKRIKGELKRVCIYWKCICECGNTCKIMGSSLKQAHSKSCGCIGMELYKNGCNYKNISFEQHCLANNKILELQSWDYELNDLKPNEVPQGSGKKYWFKCSLCNSSNLLIVKNVKSQGFSCNICSDGISYPEKFITSALKQLDVEFTTQLNKSIFEWCDKYKYDFYIPSKNCIVETHGKGHYEYGFESCGGKTLIEEQENDEYKEKLAKDNGIINYIVLDCRKSELELIKNSVLNSKLASMFDLNIISFNKCHENALTSKVIDVCNLYNNGITNTNEIGKLLNIHRGTALRYLRKCDEIGLCKYNPNEYRSKAGKTPKTKRKR